MLCDKCEKEMELIKDEDGRTIEIREVYDDFSEFAEEVERVVGSCSLRWYCNDCNCVTGYSFNSFIEDDFLYYVEDEEEVRELVLSEAMYNLRWDRELPDALKTACKNNGIDVNTLLYVLKDKSNAEHIISYHERLDELKKSESNSDSTPFEPTFEYGDLDPRGFPTIDDQDIPF